jgi:hypothetical protein
MMDKVKLKNNTPFSPSFIFYLFTFNFTSIYIYIYICGDNGIIMIDEVVTKYLNFLDAPKPCLDRLISRNFFFY